MPPRRLCIFSLCLLALSVPAAEPADQWIDTPADPSLKRGTRQQFADLKAEVIIGRLTVFWRSDRLSGCSGATLYYSHDHPGHWPSRDWRKQPLRRRQNLYDARIPIADLDVPVVYFLVAKSPDGPLASPARIVHPRKAGMEKPSTVFWPFIEGFENGAESWTLHDASLSDQARSGAKALEIPVQSASGPVTISTTRVRGWHFVSQRARAIRVWLRSDSPATARFFLSTDALTPEEQRSVSSVLATTGPQWRAVDLPLSSFGVKRPSRIDRFAIEFTAATPTRILVDDLQYLGRWHVKGL